MKYNSITSTNSLNHRKNTAVSNSTTVSNCILKIFQNKSNREDFTNQN